MPAQDNSRKQPFTERRSGIDRRQCPDRRSGRERRFDRREGNRKEWHRGLKGWFRSLFHARLGVDRRKSDRRKATRDRRQNNRQLTASTILTQEELNDLLTDDSSKKKY